MTTNLFEMPAAAMPPDQWLLAAASGAAAATLVPLAAVAICRAIADRPAPLRHGILLTAVVAVIVAVPVGVAARRCGLGLLEVAASSPGLPFAEASFELPTSSATPAALASTVPEADAASGSDDPSTETTKRATTCREMLRRVGTAGCMLWLAGILVGLLLLVRDLAALRGFARSLRPCPDRMAARLLVEAARRVGLSRPPRLCESAAVGVPVVAGPLTPVVVLPTGLVGRMPEDRLSAVLVHETAHVAHGDLWVGCLQRLAAILFWWSPPLHAVNRRLADLREDICDNHVVNGGDGRVLAEVLVELATAVPEGRWRLAAGMLGTIAERPGLVGRVERLLRPEGRDTATRMSLAAWIVTGCFAVAAVAAVAVTTIDASETPAIDLSALTADEVAAIDGALEWLAGRQDEDGGWTLQFGEGRDRVAATSIAILPFLGRGHTHRQGPYQDRLAKGIDFLVDRVTRGKGGVVGNGASMYTQGLVTMALCRAYGMTNDEALAGPAQSAIDFIEAAQDPNGGGWRYMPKQPGDTSAAGWQFAALASGKAAGLEVDPLTIVRLSQFLDGVQADGGSTYGYVHPGHGEATTAIGLLVRSRTGWTLDDKRLLRGAKAVAAKGPSPNLYRSYYATQLLHTIGGDDDEAWRKGMRRLLLETQVAEGNDRGSWLEGVEGYGCRLLCTSFATMILEAPLAPRPR